MNYTQNLKRGDAKSKMSNKAIIFNLPWWMVVFLKVSKKILVTLTITGAVGMVADSTYQFTPLAMLVFICLREAISEFMAIYISQEISDDDK